MKEKEFLPLIGERLGIADLNAMQRRMLTAQSRKLMLLAPTGSGKTLAFLLPVLKAMKAPCGRTQAVVIAPTRELVVQIAHVARQLAVGYKVTALYGGHSTAEETASLSVTPDILVGTPGRLLDHSRRGTLLLGPVTIVVLDEFDKSLELGFEKEMTKIMDRLTHVVHLILTSATPMEELPDFIPATGMETISFIPDNKELRHRLRIHRVDSDQKDKVFTLVSLLADVMPTGQERTIVFVNYRESAERLASALRSRGMTAGLYHGALEQQDREIALEMFNNGTTPLLIATDLASRGLDVAGVEQIVHYHQPVTAEAFTHRNGRTARAGAQGDAYVLIGPQEDIKPYVDFDDTYFISHEGQGRLAVAPETATLYISAGKKDKLSRGDIVGFLTKIGGLDGKDIGHIYLSDRYALAAVLAAQADALLKRIDGQKIKGQKRRITLRK